MSKADEDLLDALDRAVREMNEKIATCHERRACPKCLAPVGTRCVRASRAMTRTGVFATAAPTLKHPHEERYRGEVQYR